MADDKTTWQRARHPEQKEERREAILNAAANLLAAGGLEATGLNAIARAAKISKANIYRYFESRECILLQLLLTEAESWSSAFAKRLKKTAGTSDVDAIAKAFADTIAKRQHFCILVGSLASVLEHNVSVETVIAFKRRFLTAIEPALASLEASIPAFTNRRAFTTLSMLIMTASGAWPHCHPAAVVDEALELPEFASMRQDFRRTMRDHAAALLRGLQER